MPPPYVKLLANAGSHSAATDFVTNQHRDSLYQCCANNSPTQVNDAHVQLVAPPPGLACNAKHLHLQVLRRVELLDSPGVCNWYSTSAHLLPDWAVSSSWGKELPPSCPLGLAQQKASSRFPFCDKPGPPFPSPVGSFVAFNSPCHSVAAMTVTPFVNLVCHSPPALKSGSLPSLAPASSPAKVARLAAACRIGTFVRA